MPNQDKRLPDFEKRFRHALEGAQIQEQEEWERYSPPLDTFDDLTEYAHQQSLLEAINTIYVLCENRIMIEAIEVIAKIMIEEIEVIAKIMNKENQS